MAEARTSFGNAASRWCESDGSDVAAISALMDGIKAKHGKLDIAFVNAGVALFAPNRRMVDEAFFDNQFSLNVRGAYFTIQKAAAIMAGWWGDRADRRASPA